MIDLVIVGAGGVGRAAAATVAAINAERPTWRLLGFLDDQRARQGEHLSDLPLLGGTGWLAGRDEVAAHVAIGSPALRRRIVRRLSALGVRTFATLVHPSVQLPPSARIGPGCFIYPGAIIDVDVTIGAHVIVNINSAICHDDQLADYVTIAPGVSLGGAVRLGEGAELGIGSCTIQGVSVGAWSVVGAGAAVISDLPANCTAVGVPARVIKMRVPGWHEHEP